MKYLKLLIILSLLICTTCSKPAKVKIAIMTKLNLASIVGSSEVNASRLFMEDYPETKLEISCFDDKWLPDETIRQYEIIKKEQIDIIITSHVSTCVIAIRDRINTDQIFAMVTGATTDELTKKDDMIFRNMLDVEKEQERIAEYMNQTINGGQPDFKGRFEKLLIIRDIENVAYTTPALKFFLDHYLPKDYQVIDINMSDLNIDQLQQQMKALHFKSLYLLIGGYKTNCGSIAQLASSLEPNLPIMYTPWMKSPSLLETAGATIDNSIIPSHYPPKGQNHEVDHYMKRYKEKYGNPPTFISLNVYSALEIINQAVENGSKKPLDIKKYILKTKTFKTRFGNVSFNEYGDVDIPLYFVTHIKDEFQR